VKVLILGGNGFIGSHLTDRLYQRGHSIRIYDRGPNRFRQTPTGIDSFYGNYVNAEGLSDAVAGMDVVFHLISTTVPSTSNADPEADVTENLLSTIRLLNIMRTSGCRRIVFLSSGGTVYGRTGGGKVSEDADTLPICSHGVVKRAVELYLHMYHELYGFEYVVLRVANPYGARQGHFGVQGVIGTFMEKIKRQETLEIWGDGSVTRDYVYVEDVAEACELAAGSGACGVFNIGSGVGLTLNEIIQTLSDVTGQEIVRTYLAGREYDVPAIVLNCDKAFSELSWKSKTRFIDGITKTWDWARSELR